MAGIFESCVFYLDPDARLGGPMSLSGEQQSQDFADTSTSDFTGRIEEQGGTVLIGAYMAACAVCAVSRRRVCPERCPSMVDSAHAVGA